MNIDIFIQARKDHNLSQGELAEGICTQATLSKFENSGQIPKMKILLELCQRINLSLGDLFPKQSIQVSKEVERMDEAEFLLITSEYKTSKKILDEVNYDELEDLDMIARYHYLKAYLKIFHQAPISDILFEFDQILLGPIDDISVLYQLLTTTGVGMVYAQTRDFNKAEFYFNKVLEKIYTIPINNTHDIWRVLSILYYTGEFYSNHNNISLGNALLEYAVKVCQDNHVTYYLARATYQLALNAIESKVDSENVIEMIHDGTAYAKINRNEILINKFKLLKESLL